MPSLLPASILAIVAALLSWSLVGLYARAMARSRRLDKPNERSLHRVAGPVGAGLAIVATTLVLWPLSQGVSASAHVVLLGCFAALGSLSWVDDRRPLSAATRLGAQA